MFNFESCIQGDCAIVICKFLDPIDILTLYNMYPKILPKIINIYKQRIGEHIDEFFRYSFKTYEKYIEFRKAMIESGAVFSGSFIIQVILNEKWYKKENVPSDIDLFVSVDKIRNSSKGYWHNWKRRKDVTFSYYDEKGDYELKYTSLHKILYKYQVRNKRLKEALERMQEKYSREFGTYSKKLTRSYDESNFVTHSFYREDFGKSVILRINEYRILKYKFEVVEIDREKYNTFEEFMEQTVDFDICKNYFRYTNEGFQIHIENLPNIIHKQMHILRNRSADRLKKYTERGFNF